MIGAYLHQACQTADSATDALEMFRQSVIENADNSYSEGQKQALYELAKTQ